MAHIPDWDDDDFDLEGGGGEFIYNPADSRCYIRQLVGYITTHKGTEIVTMLVTPTQRRRARHRPLRHRPRPRLQPRHHQPSRAPSPSPSRSPSSSSPLAPRASRTAFNALDFLLVVIALITIAVFGWQDGGSISAFRALRVFRIFRLLHKFESLQTVIEGILQSVASIGYLSFLILLFLYVWGIMGMQVFGIDYGKADPDGIRDSFGTIWQSLILTFIVVTGDNWTDKMQVGMSSYSNGLEVIPVVYFNLALHDWQLHPHQPFRRHHRRQAPGEDGRARRAPERRGAPRRSFSSRPTPLVRWRTATPSRPRSGSSRRPTPCPATAS